MRQVPRLFLPVPSRVHPEVEAVHRHTVDWAFDLGLLQPGTRKYERFLGARFAWFAASCWPQVSLEALEIISDLSSFLFLYDDEVDDQQLYGGAAHRERLARRTRRYLELYAGASPRPEDDPTGRAIVDVRRRIASRFPAFSLDLLMQRVTLYIRSLQWEHELRAQGRTPILAEYNKARFHTSGIHPCLLMSLLEADAASIHTVVSDVFIQMMEQAAVYHGSWLNDVHSVEKEEREGVSANLVLILEREQGLGREAAVREAVQRIDGEMRAFLRLREVLEEQRAPLFRRYVQGMLAWMRGCADWHTAAQRYRAPQPEARPGLRMSRLAVTASS